MLTEEILSPIFTDINPNNKTVSIAIETVIKKDGIQIAKSRERRAFVPGQIEDVKKYIGQTQSPEISYLDSLWTDSVITAYSDSLNASEIG
jgi:hypothetical protein